MTDRPEGMTDRFVLDDAKVQAYAKLELSDEAISRGWINWSDTAILACREIARLRADGATLRERVRTREEAEQALTVLAMEKIFGHPKASTWPYTEVRVAVLDLIFASAPKEPTP